MREGIRTGFHPSRTLKHGPDGENLCWIARRPRGSSAHEKPREETCIDMDAAFAESHALEAGRAVRVGAVVPGPMEHEAAA
jgi:hypothetical protein